MCIGCGKIAARELDYGTPGTEMNSDGGWGGADPANPCRLPGSALGPRLGNFLAETPRGSPKNIKINHPAKDHLSCV